MYRFDPGTLKEALAGFPAEARVAFALACAERLAQLSQSASDPEARELATNARNFAQQFVAGGAVHPDDVSVLAVQLESCPHLDSDDIAASAYVLDCLRANDPQAAVWAAQRAYDARDLAAQQSMQFTAYTPGVELALLSDSGVQAELASQASDLNLLRSNPLAASHVATRARAIGGEPHV